MWKGGRLIFPFKCPLLAVCCLSRQRPLRANSFAEHWRSDKPASSWNCQLGVLLSQLRVTIPDQGKPLAFQNIHLDSAASCLDEASGHNSSRHVRLTPPLRIANTVYSSSIQGEFRGQRFDPRPRCALPDDHSIFPAHRPGWVSEPRSGSPGAANFARRAISPAPSTDLSRSGFRS